MENSWILVALAYAVAFAFISKLITNRHGLKRKLPPGPKPWPIIGHLNLLGPLPHQSLHLLSQKYGELMLLKFGKFPVVVASSPEMAKQFLRVHDAVFASRPLLAAGKYISYNHSDMTWSPYGPYWRQTRKIYLSEMFNAKKLESFEQLRMEERCNFLACIRALSGKPVLLRDHLSRYTLSTICRMISRDKCFGRVEKVDEFRAMVDEWFLLSGVFNIGDWIPWLAFLDLQGYVKKMKGLKRKMDRVYNYVINDHLARKSAERELEGKDLVDVLLEMAGDPNLDVQLTKDCVKALIQRNQAPGCQIVIQDRYIVDGKTFSSFVENSTDVHQIEMTNPSGANLETIKNRAEELMKGERGYEGGFNFDHVWSAIQPTLQTEMLASSNEPLLSPEPSLSSFSINLHSENNSSGAGSGNGSGGTTSRRPMGVKKSKMKKKQNDADHSKFQAIYDQNEHLSQILKNSHEIKARELQILSDGHELRARELQLQQDILRAKKNKTLAINLSSIENLQQCEFLRLEQ